MTKENSTPSDNATANELVTQFPITGEPFAVWYSMGDGAVKGCWAINDENGEAVYETPLYESAVKLSCALTSKPEKLEDVLSVLDQKMKSGDDQAKRRIFNKVICRLSEALPDSPIEEQLKTTAPTPAHVVNLIDAGDKLREAAFLAKFIQSISLNSPNGGSFTLNPDQLTGFYFAMKNTIDRIMEADVLIDMARKQPEAVPV